MITELSRDVLVELGARHRGDFLVEQAWYSLRLAEAGCRAREDVLPPATSERSVGR